METSHGNMPRQSDWGWKRVFIRVVDPDSKRKSRMSPLSPPFYGSVLNQLKMEILSRVG